jgi:hypothetical protein
MKKYLFTFLALLLFIKLNAQEKTLDTIYIRTNIEDVSAKFHSTFENQYKINFFFKIDWQLHGYKRDRIFFSYLSPKKIGTNEWSIFIKDEKEFLIHKNYFTLEHFCRKLKEQNFFLAIFNGKVQIIVLYGAKCSSKVEIYPVKLGTDISNEG